MKRPSSGSQKKVTVENLVGLGAERLAEILVGVADTRADLKRRLRMELAAKQGPAPLAAEIDKRLNAFETSRGQITWRQRPAFIRDLDALRDLIVARLAKLDGSAAIERLWRFMDTARQSERRYRERNGEMEGVYERAAADLGELLAPAAAGPAAALLVESITKHPLGWKAWLPGLLARASQPLAEEALRFMSERRGAVPGWITLIRQLADAARDVDAYRATYAGFAWDAFGRRRDRPAPAGRWLGRGGGRGAAARRAGAQSPTQALSRPRLGKRLDRLPRSDGARRRSPGGSVGLIRADPVGRSGPRLHWPPRRLRRCRGREPRLRGRG